MTNHPKEVGTHITPVEEETGGSRTAQVVMGSPDLRHDEDNDQITSSSQPESKLPRDNDAGEKTAVHNTIHSGSDDEKTGRPDSPQSENNERFTRQEKEPTQESIRQNDSRGSGANILPPDVVKGQAENEDNEKEMNLREIYLMSRDQQNMVQDVQRSQEDMQRKQQDFILATVQKSIATEAKATQKLMMEQEEKILQLLHSSAAKKIDWSEASDDEDEISPKPETKSADSKFDTMHKLGGKLLRFSARCQDSVEGSHSKISLVCINSIGMTSSWLSQSCERTLVSTNPWAHPLSGNIARIANAVQCHS